MLYKEWLWEWLAVCVRPTTKQQTYEKYRRICKLHIAPKLGELEPEKLSAGILQRFVADEMAEFSPNTVNVVVSVLKKSLRQAVLNGVATCQHSDCVIRPKMREKNVLCFTKEEQKKMEEYILRSGKQKLVGILLCLYSGLRIGELMALTWKEVDLAAGLVTIAKSCHDGWGSGGLSQIVEAPKTGSSVRLIPIPKQLIGVLRRAKREGTGEYVVGGDKPVSVRSYQRTFELLQKKLHIPHRGFHALRHTFATRALECGMDVKTLSEILGHKNPNVTLSRYAHSLMDHKRLMMNRLGKLLQ